MISTNFIEKLWNETEVIPTVEMESYIDRICGDSIKLLNSLRDDIEKMKNKYLYSYRICEDSKGIALDELIEMFSVRRLTLEGVYARIYEYQNISLCDQLKLDTAFKNKDVSLLEKFLNFYELRNVNTFAEVLEKTIDLVLKGSITDELHRKIKYEENELSVIFERLKSAKYISVKNINSDVFIDILTGKTNKKISWLRSLAMLHSFVIRLLGENSNVYINSHFTKVGKPINTHGSYKAKDGVIHNDIESVFKDLKHK